MSIIVEYKRGDIVSIFTNAYDLDERVERQMRKIIKTYLKKKKTMEDKIEDKITLKNIIDEIADNHMTKLDIYTNFYSNQNDLLEIASKDNKFILDIFDMNNFIKILETIATSEEIDLFINNDQFRRNILYASLFKIIKDGGAYRGAEYGLLFAKAFNFDIAIPMTYASYDSSMSNPRLKEFIDKYFELGGSINTYWLPNYYSNNIKNKYNMLELQEVVGFIDYLKDNKSYYKKLH
jgi:hypothetical protein